MSIKFDLWRTCRLLMRVVAVGLVLYTPITHAQQTPAPVSISFDFRDGSLGWEAGFADYPPATNKNDLYELRADIRSLPPELGQAPEIQLQTRQFDDCELNPGIGLTLLAMSHRITTFPESADASTRTCHNFTPRRSFEPANG